MRTIDWIKAQELPSGGLAAWPGEKAYPEVTGYLIPSLLNYGEDTLAGRLGDWLENIQNEDGAFDGLDGVKRTFDTAAVVEGLRALGRTSATERALKWMEKHLFADGNLATSGGAGWSAYNWRALAIMGRKIEPPVNWWQGLRTHYFAYALEGLLNMGRDIRGELERVNIPPVGALVPAYLFESTKDDTCATAQLACLHLRAGDGETNLVETMRKAMRADGSFSHDSADRRPVLWPCKFYLDMETML